MRHTVVSVRVTTEEHDRLRAIAEARGLSISDLIRSLVKQETTPQAIGRSIPSPAEVVVDGVPVSRSTFFWMTPGKVDGRTLTVSAA